jgi:hypothetical protein
MHAPPIIGSSTSCKEDLRVPLAKVQQLRAALATMEGKARRLMLLETTRAAEASSAGVLNDALMALQAAQNLAHRQLGRMWAPISQIEADLAATLNSGSSAAAL